MTMAGASPDLEINSAVRRVLVRHWIDLGRISIRTQKGKVTLHGILDKLSESGQPLAGAVVESMLGDIRAIHGVHRVMAQFENWEQSSCGWRIREDLAAERDAALGDRGLGNGPQFDIDGWRKQERANLKEKKDQRFPE